MQCILLVLNSPKKVMQRQLPARLMKSMSVSSLPATTNLQELAFAHPKGLSMSLWLQCYLFLFLLSPPFNSRRGFMEHMVIFNTVISMHLFMFSFQFLNFLASGSLSNWMIKDQQNLRRLCFLNIWKLWPCYVVIDNK